MSDFADDLVTGFAMHLDALGVGVWRPDSPYEAGEIAISLAGVPQKPHQTITLSAYDVDNDPSLSHSTMGLQVRTRGLPGAVANVTGIASPLFDQLHGSHGFRLPTPPGATAGVWVVQCLLRSSVSGGQDGNDRWSYIQNFYVDVHRPSIHRT